jgi:hypothetical protein
MTSLHAARAIAGPSGLNKALIPLADGVTLNVRLTQCSAGLKSRTGRTVIKPRVLGFA